MKKSVMVLALGVIFACPQVLFAATINVPAEQPTIQAGINSAVNGDTVLVAPGVYSVNLDFNGKILALIGDTYRGEVIIVPALASSPMVLFHSGEAEEALISGFHFKNSDGAPAIRVEGSSPSIIGNKFSNHKSGSQNQSILRITGSSHPQIRRNTFFSNPNSWGAIWSDADSINFINNSIHSGERGMVIYSPNSLVKNNIVTGCSFYGFFNSGYPMTRTYNDIWGNSSNYYGGMQPDASDISADPLFVDAENGDLYLLQGSPCIDAGDPDTTFDDPDGTRSDIGALYYDQGPTLLKVPSEYPTIQAGIAAATNGDTVLVEAGTYSGPGNTSINLNSKRIFVMSETGCDNTVIDCSNPGGQPHIGFLIVSGEDTNTTIEGFKITNAAIGIDVSSSPRLRKNCFVDCSVGVRINYESFRHSGPLIDSATFLGNQTGVLVYCDVDMRLENVRLSKNGIAIDTYGGGDCTISIGIDSSTLDSNIIGVSSSYFLNINATNTAFNYNTTAIWASERLRFYGDNCIFWGNRRTIYSNGIEGGMVASIMNSEFRGGSIALIYPDMFYSYNSNFMDVQDTLFVGTASRLTSEEMTADTSSRHKYINQMLYGVQLKKCSLSTITTLADMHGLLGEDHYFLYFDSCQLRNCGGITAYRTKVSILACKIENIGGIAITGNALSGILEISESNFFNFGEINTINGTGSVLITNSIFSNGAGISTGSVNDNIDILGSSFIFNDYGISVNTGYWGDVSLSENLIAFNRDYGIAIDTAASGVFYISCNNIYGNILANYYGIRDQSGANGNISADPLFCYADTGNYYLHNISPCAPQNNSCGVLMGAFDVGCQFDLTGHGIENESVMNVLDHTPNIYWSYPSNPPVIQDSFNLAVGNYPDWTYSELWNPSPVASSDTFVTYAGLPLNDGQTYYYRLRVHNGAAWSNWHESSFRMNSVPQVPVTVSPIEEQLINTPTVNLNALRTIDAEGDQVSYDFEVDKGGTLVASGYDLLLQGDTVTWMVNSPLSENDKFNWKVRAYDQFEHSNWSLPQSFWVNLTEEPPLAFLIYSLPLISNTYHDMKPSFSWMPAQDPDPLDSVKYIFLVSIDSLFQFAYEVEGLIDTVYAYDDSLQFGAKYWWKVKAVDKTGLYRYSDTQGFRTWKLGDANSDWVVNILDVTFLISALYKGGNQPSPAYVGDVNGNCVTNILDATYLIAYLYKSGASPRVGCE